MNEKILKTLEYHKIIDQLVNQAETTLGKARAKLTIPSTDLSEVLQRHVETDEAVQILRLNQSLPFGGVTRISEHIKRAEIGGILSAKECVSIASTLYGTKNIKRYISQMEAPVAPVVRALVSNLEPLSELEREISTCIDADGHVLDAASTALRQIRTHLRTGESRVRERLENIVRNKANMLSDTIITIRNDRYVLPVKQEYRQAIGGIVHDQSASGQTLFMEPQSVVDVNNKLSELKASERNEIEKILRDISGEIAKEHVALRQNEAVLTELDYIFSRGKLSQVMHASMPKINDVGYIQLKQARHPLLTDDEVVANDIELGKDYHAIVITGPNTGGKTGALKLVGIFCLMAQSGLQVPAQDGCSLAVFDDIFADIGDEQSIEQSLSTFSSHMKNIIDILNKVSDQSLILFDELGSGTDPQEGAALAMAILDEVISKNARVIATTHYPELKAYGYNREGVVNASVEFNVETLRPTYRLLIGVPGRSNAFDISKRLGLDEALIDVAKGLIGTDTKSVDHMITSLDTARRQAEDEQAKTAQLLIEAEQLKADLERKWHAFEESKRSLYEKAEEKAQEKVEKARLEAEAIVADLRKIQSDQPFKEHVWIDTKKQLEDVVPTFTKADQFNTVAKKENEQLTLGTDVLITSINQQGTIVKIVSDKEFQVQVGMMKMNVKRDQLKKVTPKKAQQRPVAMVKNKQAPVKMELDLRGERYEDAKVLLEKYIDDALLNGYGRVSIIHGKGTGALRTLVLEFAKYHRQIKKATSAQQKEGGTGVTILEF